MLADIDLAVVTLSVGIGGAIGTVMTGLIAAVAPIRNAATKALQAALEEQRIQIKRIASEQAACERERADDRERAAQAQARNERRIRHLEEELADLRRLGDTT